MSTRYQRTMLSGYYEDFPDSGAPWIYVGVQYRHKDNTYINHGISRPNAAAPRKTFRTVLV